MVHAFLCSNQYDAIWGESQSSVIKSGFNGQCVGAVVAQVVHGDLVSHRTDDSVAIMSKNYVTEPVHGAQ